MRRNVHFARELSGARIGGGQSEQRDAEVWSERGEHPIQRLVIKIRKQFALHSRLEQLERSHCAAAARDGRIHERRVQFEHEVGRRGERVRERRAVHSGWLLRRLEQRGGLKSAVVVAEPEQREQQVSDRVQQIGSRIGHEDTRQDLRPVAEIERLEYRLIARVAVGGDTARLAQQRVRSHNQLRNREWIAYSTYEVIFRMNNSHTVYLNAGVLLSRTIVKENTQKSQVIEFAGPMDNKQHSKPFNIKSRHTKQK